MVTHRLRLAPGRWVGAVGFSTATTEFDMMNARWDGADVVDGIGGLRAESSQAPRALPVRTEPCQPLSMDLAREQHDEGRVTYANERLVALFGDKAKWMRRGEHPAHDSTMRRWDDEPTRHVVVPGLPHDSLVADTRRVMLGGVWIDPAPAAQAADLTRTAPDAPTRRVVGLRTQWRPLPR